MCKPLQATKNSERMEMMRADLDERVYAALSYANKHPDMEAYKRGLESQAEFDDVVERITGIDGIFEMDIPSLSLNK